MTSENLKSVTRNATAMFSSQLATWISGFILMMLLPRYLGSEDYGRLFLALSITSIFEVLINYGGQYHITKETARDPGHAAGLLVDSMVIRAGLWIVSIAGMAALCAITGYPPLVRDLVMILGVSKLWECGSWVLRWCYQGFERMEYPSMGALLERLILTIAGVGALLLGAGSTAIALVMALSMLVKFIYLASKLGRIIPALPSPDWSAIGALIRQAVPYFVWSAAAVIYYRIDAVMLSLMTPDSVVGWYGAAYRFFDILMFLPSIFTTALFPVISRLWKTGGPEFGRTTRNSLEFIIAAGIPVAVAVFAFSGEIIGLFFGLPEFSESVSLLRIFAAGMVLVYVDFVLGTTVLAEDRQRQWSVVASVAILVNILLNYAMIPYFQGRYGNGAIGAAIATVLTESFIFAAGIANLPRKEQWMPRWGLLLKCAASALVMWGVFSVAKFQPAAWPLTACLGIAGYALTLVALKPLDEKESRILRDAISLRGFRGLFATGRRGGE